MVGLLMLFALDIADVTPHNVYIVDLCEVFYGLSKTDFLTYF